MPMKATGIVRPVDELGRIVLPKELRTVLGLEHKAPIEIFVEENRIILQRYQPACMFCDSREGVIEYKGAKVCEDCMGAVMMNMQRKEKDAQSA